MICEIYSLDLYWDEREGANIRKLMAVSQHSLPLPTSLFELPLGIPNIRHLVSRRLLPLENKNKHIV